MHSVWHVSTLWSYTYWIHWIVASAADVGLLGRDVISNVHAYTEAVGATPTRNMVPLSHFLTTVSRKRKHKKHSGPLSCTDQLKTKTYNILQPLEPRWNSLRKNSRNSIPLRCRLQDFNQSTFDLERRGTGRVAGTNSRTYAFHEIDPEKSANSRLHSMQFPKVLSTSLTFKNASTSLDIARTLEGKPISQSAQKGGFLIRWFRGPRTFG